MSVLTAAPWRRAPLLLLRGNSAVLAALLFAGLILGAATAATPLFLSSVRNAALAEQLAQRCAAEYGFEVMTSGPLGAPSPTRDDFSAISRHLTEERVDFSWELPLARPLTLDQGRETVAHLPEVDRALLQSGGCFKPGARILHNAPRVVRTRSELPFLVQRSDLAQQQRAAVARALVLTPQLVLADEPSAHQDALWVHDVSAALRQIAHDARAACLVATHDPEAIRYTDRVLHLIDGELGERAW